MIFGCKSFNSVIVFDEDGAPVSGASIFVIDYSSRSDDGFVGYTDDAGLVLVSRKNISPTGMWTILIKKTGFKNFRLDNNEDLGLRENVEIVGRDIFVTLE